MKRVLAFILILALLVPMGLSVNAAKAETKPFYMVNWDQEGIEGQDYTNVYPMVYLWANPSRFTETDAYVYCPWLGGTKPIIIAENVKKLFDTYPEGARYINYSPLATALHYYAEDVFVDAGLPYMIKWMEEFASHYKSIGGKLDGFTIDIEFTDIWASYIDSKAAKDPMIYNRIVNHPTYKEKIRPQLVERGFKFYPNVTEQTPEIYGLSSSTGTAYSQSRSIWNSVMRNYIGDVIREACEPLWKYYPDALVSDYTTKDSKPWNMDQEVSNSGGNWIAAGNMSNENFYNIRPNTSFYENNKFSTIPGYNSVIYEKTAYHRFQYDNNVAKTTRMSSDNGDISYWIVGHGYGAKGEGSICDTPYYAENLIHMGMTDPQIFLGYVLQQDAKNDLLSHLILSMNIIDDILVELTRVVGGADREPIVTPPSMNDHYVLSGMHVGGKNVWRLTPDTGMVSLENFKVAGDDPTFSVGGQTISFPGGKIIETGSVREVGTCGYWIETAENVNPVVTRTEDYFRNNTGYQESYDAFETGMTYDYNNAKPASCWEIKINKNTSSSSTIVADPADATKKVLELKGNVTLTNVKMPKIITAGDSYAENQAWEVSVTLPADLPAEAEIVLLKAANEKKKTGDDGFKIAGGKVYYANESEYVELEGITLSSGVEYTFVRDMNFNDAENFACDYYIYDASGALVAAAKKIPVEEFVLPVHSVILSCANVTGGAVLLDDYRLYPSRVTTDFNLYNANTGMKVTETDKAQASNVAFRLSWLNATNTEKSFTVMAAYYEGDKLISEEAVKEVKMAANLDGIVTGVVENKQEGKTLLVYLKDNNPNEDLVVLENPVTVKVTKDDVTLREGPGTNYAQAGAVAKDQELVVTETMPGIGCTWGKVEGGWINLDDTNYKTVIQENNQTEEPSGLDNQLIIIIAAAAAAVIVVVVVVIIIAVSAKKKKQPKAKEDTTETPNEE